MCDPFVWWSGLAFYGFGALLCGALVVMVVIGGNR